MINIRDLIRHNCQIVATNFNFINIIAIRWQFIGGIFQKFYSNLRKLGGIIQKFTPIPQRLG